MAKTPGNWTAADLKDFLDLATTLAAFRMDFFINTDNACDISGNANPMCTATVVDILTLHNPGNHTVHHAWLGGNMGDGQPFCADTTCVDTEITGVETVINTISGGGRPHLTRFRPPYGNPYNLSGTVAWVQPEVAKFAVAIGWNFDSNDSGYDTGTVLMMPDATCVTYGTSTPAPCPTGAQIAATVEMQSHGRELGHLLDARHLSVGPTTP